MIERLVDTNVFIRVLVGPREEEGRARHFASTALFERVEVGDERLLTTEACLAEIVHVLTSKRQYGQPKSVAVAALRSIESNRHIRIIHADVYPVALDLLDSYPKLDFEDALLAAHAIRLNLPLLSYDLYFDQLPGVTRVEPPAAS